MVARAERGEHGWVRQDAEWRDPAQVASQWEDASRFDPKLLRFVATDSFWELLDAHAVSLLVTREYEHLAMSLCVVGGRPRVTFMRLPHPSGVAVDRRRDRVVLASTRNPNLLFEFGPVVESLERTDAAAPSLAGCPLVPLATRSFPGCLYLHDLAFVGGALHGNAVGQNAVVRFDGETYERVWWPRCIEVDGVPDFTRNYIQLNSIAAGADVESSFFSASATTVSARRPGHKNFPVDGRGAIFSGRTREPLVTGLTRPHSARLYRGRLWLDNSGYGELGVVDGGSYAPVARVPGWTRGLTFHGDVAFVGVSRVIPRFRQYAPGLDDARSVCGVYAVAVGSGEIVGALRWPDGNQVFAVEWIPRTMSTGFPFHATRRNRAEARRLFYSFAANGYAGGADG